MTKFFATLLIMLELAYYSIIKIILIT